MILDITAGNRHIWGGWMPELQEEGPIIFFDIEPRLKIPPDVICDLVYLPVRDGLAAAVVADPPYWNFGTSKFHGDPKEALGSWWGNFKNLTNLRRILVGIVKSSRRILRSDGHLYLKWCDVTYPWSRWEALFGRDFSLEDTLTKASGSGRNSKPCYWFTFSKRTSDRYG